MMGWLQRKNYDSGQVDYSRLVAELIRQLGGGGNSRLQRLEDTLEVTLNRLTTLEETVEKMSFGVERNYTTKLIGKKEELSSEMVNEYKDKDYEELRIILDKNVKQIARSTGKQIRRVRNDVYTKLADVTGFNVFDVGPVPLYDREKGINRGSSLVNTLITHGYIAEAVVISDDMKRGVN